MTASLGTAVYVAVSPKSSETFTEFYLLGRTGVADIYPTGLLVGQTGTATLVAVNRERELVSYRVVVMVNGEKSQEIDGITLENDQQWKQDIPFEFDTAGPSQVSFQLYRLPFAQPYREVYLRVFVETQE